MEEEINYSTVLFKNGGPAPKEKKEDLAIYSEVKHKGPANTVPEKKEDLAIDSEVKPKGPAAPVPADGEAPANHHFRMLAVCVGILCVLLVASISSIIYISVVMTEQKANLMALTAANQQLLTERNILGREAEELSKVTDNLNWTLRVILKFSNFPVNEYCPEKKCQPCKNNWIMFQGKCYLFYNEDAPWKTWGQSRTYCQQTAAAAADLVVVDSLQEQEFINNHTKYYYDKYHGYWIGLNETNKNWLWVDGRNDTLRYWIKEDLGTLGPCALMIPWKNATDSWDPADCEMNNKFICESEVLIKSN
ncbi:C-type lectin domain family 12 member A isoform X2 [Micropterus salmoides]|uniref:C-type lectin domain family 12 member A isoform X2 n=1 Tax=Micropterus salmoides TaxID=27706 RepID=UPI0018EC81D2|nr:C-type lectin domain family 12 member A isoform X2 [Micropterus salmoides]